MPTHAHPILHRRHLVLTLVRAGAVVVALTGVFVLGWHVVPLTERLFGFGIWQYWAAFATMFTVFILPAIFLAVFSGMLARWIVPAPLLGCPACGYAVTAQQTTCPECGTKVRESAKDHAS